MARSRLHVLTALGLLLLAIQVAVAQGTKATLKPRDQRKKAPELGLQDANGSWVNLKAYQGKVVVLDFWATWCHGCKEEIPWFAQVERRYAGKGLSVIGVSLDEDGWKVVKPFIEATEVPYRIVLGDDRTAQQYGIESMPDTFLIDRTGQIAATYAGLVDRENIEENIQRLLSQ